MKDRRSSQGNLFSGERVVRKGGIVKFDGIIFKSDSLLDYVGKVVEVIMTGSPFKIYHITCRRGNEIVAIINNPNPVNPTPNR